MSSNDRRQNTYTAPGYNAVKGQNMQDQYGQPNQLQGTQYGQPNQTQGTGQYLPRGLPLSHQMGENNMPNLTASMASMNLHASYGSSGTSKSGASVMSGNSSDYGGMAMAHGQGLWLPNQHIMGSMYPVQQQNGHSPGMYNHAGAFVAGAGYPYGQGMADNSPVPHTWTNRISDMPSLMTPRRDSLSSNENDIPGTPYTGGMYRYGHSAAIMDRSPSAMYTNSATPSPTQLTPYQLVAPLQKQQNLPTLPPHLLALLHKEPPIPRAIPAPSSPLKPLDRSLENKTGETNVYIRGLLPETTDEMLHAWGSRFGDIQSSKSIIDMKTNLCKGFGFIKYHNFEDAENCIRGFHYLGYEVSFARESFYAKLKKFADESNTNLYVSNIPKNMNEHELGAIFAPHRVCSSKILRDKAGVGRGVGFARFETRDICEEIIRKFNNTPVSKPGGDEHLIQIRYSDTHEQKLLKQQTAAGRVFRAAEYEVGVAQARAMSAPDRYMSLSPDEQSAANEFEVFLQGQNNTPPFMGQTARYRQPWAPAIPSTLGMSSSAIHPLVQTTMSGGFAHVEEGSSDHAVDIKTNPATPVKKDNGTGSPSQNSAHDE